MRDNVQRFAALAVDIFAAPDPVLEVGARAARGQEETAAAFRRRFAGRRYVGSDLRPGSGVDAVLDVHAFGIASDRLGTVLLIDTLEHVEDPRRAMAEVHRALRDDGVAVLTSVMNYPIHNHPWDYWRFTPAAFALLVRGFDAGAVWYQGDALAPHTVLAVARKRIVSEKDRQRFDAAVVAVEERWPSNAQGGPPIFYEPLADVLVRDHDSFCRPSRLVAPLLAGRTVEQTFDCPADGLTEVHTKYATHERINLCRLDFVLREVPGGAVVANGRFPAQHVLDKAWVPFRFPTIGRSAGRRFTLTVSSPDGRDGGAVSPLLADAPGDELRVDAATAPGSLCLRLLCRP